MLGGVAGDSLKGAHQIMGVRPMTLSHRCTTLVVVVPTVNETKSLLRLSAEHGATV